MEGKDLKREIHLSEGSAIKGRYTIQQLIGRGGFCYTYKAFELVTKHWYLGIVASRVTGNTVTVFTSVDENAFNKGKVRFLKEARNLAQFIKNPNIVSILDYFEENNTAYIVMEYLEGRDMKKHIGAEGNVLDFEYVKALANDMCDTLSQIHSAGIIHRDISPDNIFVCDDGNVKLIDFGAVKQDFNLNNETVTVILKRGYAPKEQYFSKGNLGPWTDVYALGSTIYRLVTGQVPQESIERLDDDRLIPAHLLNAEVPENFSFALMKAMALKIEDRYQSMQEFKAGLNDTGYHSTDYYSRKEISDDNTDVKDGRDTQILIEQNSITQDDGFKEISEMKMDESLQGSQNIQGKFENKPGTVWHTAELIPQESIEWEKNQIDLAKSQSENANNDTIVNNEISELTERKIENSGETLNEIKKIETNEMAVTKNSPSLKLVLILGSYVLAAIVIAVCCYFFLNEDRRIEAAKTFEIKDTILLVNPSVFGKDYEYVKNKLSEDGTPFIDSEPSTEELDGVVYKSNSADAGIDGDSTIFFYFNENNELISVIYYMLEYEDIIRDSADIFRSGFKGTIDNSGVTRDANDEIIEMHYSLSYRYMNGSYYYEKSKAADSYSTYITYQQYDMSVE